MGLVHSYYIVENLVGADEWVVDVDEIMSALDALISGS